MAAFLQRTFSNEFLQLECLNFDYNFIEVVPKGLINKYSNIGSDNGLAPTRQQAIIRTNAD